MHEFKLKNNNKKQKRHSNSSNSDGRMPSAVAFQQFNRTNTFQTRMISVSELIETNDNTVKKNRKNKSHGTKCFSEICFCFTLLFFCFFCCVCEKSNLNLPAHVFLPHLLQSVTQQHMFE